MFWVQSRSTLAKISALARRFKSVPVTYVVVVNKWNIKTSFLKNKSSYLALWQSAALNLQQHKLLYPYTPPLRQLTVFGKDPIGVVVTLSCLQNMNQWLDSQQICMDI